MKKFARVDFVGAVYEVPADVIARHRAAAYAHEFGDDVQQSLRDDTEPLFAQDEFAAADWARNNMNWSDLAPHARLVRYTPPPTDLSNAQITLHEQPAMIGDLDGGDAMLRAPVEMVISAMAACGNICHAGVISDAVGAPYALVAVVQGGPNIVGAYVSALTQITDALAAKAEAARAAAH